MQYYDCIELLGQGAFGQVFKGQDRISKRFVALKAIRVNDNNWGVPATTMREVGILKLLDHPYILKLEKTFRTKSTEGEEIIVAVTELLTSDLGGYMKSQFGKDVGMGVELAKHLIFQVLLGLKYMHGHSIMHRDLKPQNLLIDETTKTIKLADFGLSKNVSLALGNLSPEVCTLWYRAPEVLLGATGYSYAVDIWSVGCTFAEMVSGKPLFEFTSDIEQLEGIFRVLGTPDTSEWSPDLRLHVDLEVPVWSPQALQIAVPALGVLGNNGIQLLTDMLQVNPSRRLSAIDALKSPFFDDIRDIYVEPGNGNLTGSGAAASLAGAVP